MPINFKFARVVTLQVVLSFLSLLQQCEVFADALSVGQWESVNSQPGRCVQILLRKQHQFEPQLPTFVITHGMGGTQLDDRFHLLADAIVETLPESNVILINWTDASCKKASFLGLPSPWEVAKDIDRVALEAAENLQSMGSEASSTTFIGESFGNCVNARIAERLGRHGRMLAFNPPNAAGGYKTPNLRTCADLTWSFHTFSVFDTQDNIAHVGFFLETQVNATPCDQHVAGVSWLANQVQSGNTSWLLMQHQIAETRHDEFDAIAAISGELINDQHPPRQRPPAIDAIAKSSAPVITTAL